MEKEKILTRRILFGQPPPPKKGRGGSKHTNIPSSNFFPLQPPAVIPLPSSTPLTVSSLPPVLSSHLPSTCLEAVTPDPVPSLPGNPEEEDEQLLLEVLLADEGGEPAGLKGDDSPVQCGQCMCGCNERKGSCPAFVNYSLRLAHEVYQTGKANRDGVREELRSSLNEKYGNWEAGLSLYCDKEDVLSSIKYGWDLGFNGPEPESASRNHPSAVSNEADIDFYINTELERGSLVGPLPSVLPFPVCVAPMALVPKAGSKIGRTIVDSSWPKPGGA